MIDALLGNPLALIGVGWMIAKEIGKGGPQAQGQAQGQPQVPPPQVGAVAIRPMGPSASHDYMPGMPVQHAAPPRKPLGPVALDADIPEDVEKDVWRALGEQDETKSRDFARRLAKGGFPVAAGIVAYHATIIEMGKAALKAQENLREQANGKDHPAQAGAADEASE